jgi:hypothetical protein
MKIPPILVTCLPIVNISREAEFKRFLTPDKSSVYKPLTDILQKPVKATSGRTQELQLLKIQSLKKY